MSWTSDLISGIGTTLTTAGIGTYRPAGNYLPGDHWPIFTGAGQDQPDAQIRLSPYAATADGAMADVMQPVQFWYRGPRDDLDAVLTTSDAVFDLLHGVGQVTIGGIHVVLATRNSAMPMGQDQSDRWEWVDNYYFRAMRPTASRPD